MRPWTNVVLAVLIATSAAVPLAAAEGPRMGETIDVSVVNVDAIVTDKHGNPVRGLTKDDFEIYENGRLQPITNFSAFDGHAESAGAAPRPPASPHRLPVAVYTCRGEHRSSPRTLRKGSLLLRDLCD